ncbi:threonine--tRNA ligase [Candidatus Woesearchaeota archaeon]|nr:threonine--tRNA ligase [Candidatus Woesearchaeota archaeon]
MLAITLPDGTKVNVKEGTDCQKLAEMIGIGLAKRAVAAKVNGEMVDMDYELTKNAKVEIITVDSSGGLSILRHSASHILASAVKKLFPKAKLGIGPAIEEGFYYDFDVKEPFTPQDLVRIEKEMNKEIEKDIEFKKVELSVVEAKKQFKNEPYKLELIKELKDEKITAYKHGKFIDLCKGPHVKSTGVVKAIKLMKTAGAYWKGDSSNPQLQRIYGTAFADKKELKKFLVLLEEAEKRDHRKIGMQMELFSIHDEAPGMPFFHDKGNFIWESLKDFMTSEMRKLNYEINKTPIILNKALWLKSGHWDHYKDNMYFTKIDKADYAVKPMNCPGNLLVFKTRLHSYKELPIKAGEFGLVHRHELSGVLSGLFRVRVFTQDDAHVFCEEHQIKEQVIEILDLIDRIYSTFGFDYKVELSTKPEKAMGDPKMWEKAEKILADVLQEKKMKYKLNPGEGAFYGPKIDYHLKDTLGRTWQCGTVQLDFSMPEKFNLTYEGEDGKKHRPVMLHRAIYGSIERFLGILIEHFAGWFPLWLAPRQIRVIAVNDTFNNYAQSIVKELKKHNIRAEFDNRAETTGKKVRDSQLEKIPIVLNVGEKELKAKTVAVRTNKDGKLKFGVKLKDLISKINDNVEKKELEFKLS